MGASVTADSEEDWTEGEEPTRRQHSRSMSALAIMCSPPSVSTSTLIT